VEERGVNLNLQPEIQFLYNKTWFLKTGQTERGNVERLLTLPWNLDPIGLPLESSSVQSGWILQFYGYYALSLKFEAHTTSHACGLKAFTQR